MTRFKNRTTAVVLVVFTFVVVAAAIAAWLVFTQQGSGRGKVAVLAAPIVEPASSFTGAGDLVPGGLGEAQVLVTNGNTVPLTFVFAENSTAGNIQPANPSTCGSENFSVNPEGSTVASPTVVPANAVSFPMTIEGILRLSGSAPTGCQGQEVVFSNAIAVRWTTSP